MNVERVIDALWPTLQPFSSSTSGGILWLAIQGPQGNEAQMYLSVA